MEDRGPNYAHNPFRLSRRESAGEVCKDAEFAPVAESSRTATPLLFASAFSTAFGKTLENRKECLEKSMRRLPPKVSAVKGLTPHCRGISWH